MGRSGTTPTTAKPASPPATPPDPDAEARAAAAAAAFESAPPPPGAEPEDAPVVLTQSELANLVATAASEAVARALGAQAPATTTTIVSAGTLPSVPEPTRRQVEAAAARDQRVKDLIPDRAHLDKCPVLVTGQGRVEFYEARRPPNPARAEPAQDFTIVRCQECGGTHNLPGARAVHGL